MQIRYIYIYEYVGTDVKHGRTLCVLFDVCTLGGTSFRCPHQVIYAAEMEEAMMRHSLAVIGTYHSLLLRIRPVWEFK